ncbi:molybdenum ABC transporter substrate-binding protein [Acinetobacter sp. Marseille-Q1618]|uniref:molybdenum ABC transporter substrate-binding protein n=1 Tax=Acinetobacter sp. Marseille-Q1618 TaxID=2697502 RepID=UPI001570053D|nr:molybdenum ABC transporter substrate-binding protein [Acinetobacter sp. Marseille-Q1618]
MKNLGLISLLLVGVSFAAVGCTSTESTSAPETAATQQAPQTDSFAQAASVDHSSQTGVAVQADPTLQQSAPAQVNPEADVVEQSAVQ